MPGIISFAATRLGATSQAAVANASAWKLVRLSREMRTPAIVALCNLQFALFNLQIAINCSGMECYSVSIEVARVPRGNPTPGNSEEGNLRSSECVVARPRTADWVSGRAPWRSVPEWQNEK